MGLALWFVQRVESQSFDPIREKIQDESVVLASYRLGLFRLQIERPEGEEPQQPPSPVNIAPEKQKTVPRQKTLHIAPAGNTGKPAALASWSRSATQSRGLSCPSDTLARLHAGPLRSLASLGNIPSFAFSLSEPLCLPSLSKGEILPFQGTRMGKAVPVPSVPARPQE